MQDETVNSTSASTISTDLSLDLDSQRSAAVKKYIDHRLAGTIDELLKLLSTDCVLVDSDAKKTEYTGKDALKAYFESKPPPMVKPFISDPKVNENGTITIVLNAVIRSVDVVFEFVTESALVKKISLTERGFFG
jgi:hypothetical protein